MSPHYVWRVLLPVWVGALTPDLIDKPLKWLGYTPYGRTVGHSVLLWMACLLYVAFRHLRSRRRGPVRLDPMRWFVFGACSHLWVDLINDVVAGLMHSGYVFSTWFAFPYLTPDHCNIYIHHMPKCFHVSTPTLLEWTVVILALWVATRRLLLYRLRRI